MIKELNPKYLKKLLNNICDVVIYKEGLSEEGEPLSAINLEKQKCRFVETTKVIINAEGKTTELLGKVILLGDISPEVKQISGGIVTINEKEYTIYQANRSRNPNGTIYMTVLELI